MWIGLWQRKVPFENGRGRIAIMATRGASMKLVSVHLRENAWTKSNEIHHVDRPLTEEGSFRKWAWSHYNYGHHERHYEIDIRSFKR